MAIIINLTKLPPCIKMEIWSAVQRERDRDETTKLKCTPRGMQIKDIRHELKTENQPGGGTPLMRHNDILSGFMIQSH